MLVLTRKADEQILIGDDIKITLVKVRGGSVRIGIDAPKQVRIVRGELEKKMASDPNRDAQPSPRKAPSKNTPNPSPKTMIGSDFESEAQDEVYDDIAAAFAHPERNQVRQSYGQARRARNRSMGNLAEAARVTATRAKVQKPTRIVHSIQSQLTEEVAVSG